MVTLVVTWGNLVNVKPILQLSILNGLATLSNTVSLGDSGISAII